MELEIELEEEVLVLEEVALAGDLTLALGLAGAGLLNVLGIGLAAVMIGALVARAGRNLKRLAELEPAA